LQQKGLCAISGLPMTHDRSQGKTRTNISIDRIDSNKGYEIENVQLVCHIVNTIKSDMTMEELYFWTESIHKNARRK
jgi:hypothetical protein